MINNIERSLEMFAVFLKDLRENPNQYKEVNIQIDFVGKAMSMKHRYNFIDYKGDEIMEHKEEIQEAMTSLLIGCDIVNCDEDDSEISFCFRNGDKNNRKLIYVLCFKNYEGYI